jgi:hypothetical protein
MVEYSCFPSQQQEHAVPPDTLTPLSTLSTLWVPLDETIDQWQQVLSWLHLAGNDDQQQDPASLDTIRSLMGQINEHQARRRALHRQVQQEYVGVKQQVHRQHKEEPQR